MAQGTPSQFNSTSDGNQHSVSAQEEVSEEDMLQYIVDNSNTVLGKSLSLVEFDELGEVELLRVLADIFVTLSPKSTFNVEQGERQPLLDFLTRTIGYKIPPLLQHDFVENFYQAEKTVMYPVLYWVLKNQKQCSKRVYLATYLARIDVPEDMRMQEERVRELYQHYENLRADFIETHKRVDSLRETHADPVEARRKIEALQSEKEKLSKNIAATQKKLSNVSNKEALLAACKLLRGEQDEAAKLSEKYSEQNQALYAAEKRHTEVMQRLKHAQRDMQDGRVDSIVSRMRDEITTNKMKLQDQIPKELNEKRVENAALQQLLSEPLDVAALQRESSELDENLRQLTARVAERNKPSDDGNSIQVMRQQVKLVTKKKGEILGQLQQLQAENERRMQRLRDSETQIDHFRNQNVLSGEDFRKYSNQVRSKTATTKTMKQKLGDLRAEWGVLSYTQKTLEEQFEALRAEIQRIEETLGIKGYSDKAENLNKVTDEKNAVEEIKGKTLEELSRIVQDIMVTIRDRRNKLTPQINELRAQRQVAADVEQEWEEKRAQFEMQEGLLMQDVTKIETEVSSLDNENRSNEALYHRLQQQKLLLSVMVDRATKEKSYRSGESSLGVNGCKTLGQLLDKTISEVESRSRDLQQRRRNIDENHAVNVQQVEWFHNLKVIMEAKVAALKKGNVQAHAVPMMGGGAPGSIDLDIAAVMGNARRNDGGMGVNVLNLGGD